MLSLFAFDWIQAAGVANVSSLAKHGLPNCQKSSVSAFLQITREAGLWPDGRN